MAGRKECDADDAKYEKHANSHHLTDCGVYSSHLPKNADPPIVSLYISPELSRRFNHFTPIRDQLRDLLVLVRQQAQRVGDVIPLSLALSASETVCQLRGELFGVLVLPFSSVHDSNPTHRFP